MEKDSQFSPQQNCIQPFGRQKACSTCFGTIKNPSSLAYILDVGK